MFGFSNKQLLGALMLAGGVYFGYQMMTGESIFSFFDRMGEETKSEDNDGSNKKKPKNSQKNNDNNDVNDAWTEGLPTSNGEVVQHTYYALSYIEKHEQAEWVAYELSKERLSGERVRRNDNFRPDDKISTQSATPNDYRGSGYDRGHLCPAADMAFNENAMSETFFMSNMSPQNRQLNHGVWRELEENTRDWARKFKKIYVVTGPILNSTRGKIGKQNKVSVPTAYYKILVDLGSSPAKGIAYVIPNEVRNEPLDYFARNIDEVEKITGINFFPKMNTNTESKVETTFDINQWRYDQKRFQMRIEKWNKE